MIVIRATAVGAPRSRNIAAIAVQSNEVGVEGNEIAGFDNAIRTLLVPGIGSRSRRKQTRLQPFATMLDVLLMQNRPDRLFRLAGLRGIVHSAYSGFATSNRRTNGIEFLECFQASRLLRYHLAINRFNPQAKERVKPDGIESIDRKALIAATMGGHEIGYFGGPFSSPLT